ncbi:MAG: putative NADPH-dependent reductase [Cyanobacteria bacterium RYN_339]|nr:putative NADPH-dependent reductase [Cyanobacteria bacterium RYN_339]
MTKIGIVISTTRDARFADKPAAWLLALAQARGDFEYELVDLRDHPLPFFYEAASSMATPSEDPEGQRWERRVAEFDGFIFVTAEYNHGPSAAMKNALDYAYPAWNRKPVAFFGYGGVGAARAVEQLRLVASALEMMTVPFGVHLQGGDFMAAWKGGKPLEDFPQLVPAANRMLDQLAWWVRTLNAGRYAPV